MKMPRKTEIQAEENIVNSPLRRSSRKTVGVNSAPAPLTSRRNSQSNIETTEVSKPIKTRRSSLSQENSEKNLNTESKPATRGRRASTSKEETEPNAEPARTRSRRLSTSSETSAKEEKQTIARRRNSAASEEQNESENVDPTVKPVRGRSSVKDDEIKEQSSSRTLRSRRNSATDKEDFVDLENKGRKGTRSRRSSTDNAEEPEAKSVKLTPIKSKRRPSVSEIVVNLEPIEEQSEISKGRKSKSPVDESKSTAALTPVKKTKSVELISNLDLSIINESSFTEETSSDSQQTVILRNKSFSPQNSKNKIVIKESTPKKSNYLEVSSNKLLVSPRKSPRLNKEFDVKKSPIPKMLDLDSHISNEPTTENKEEDPHILNEEIDETDNSTRSSPEVVKPNESIEVENTVVEDESDQKTNEVLHTIETENHLNVESEKIIEIDTSQNENEDANDKEVKPNESIEVENTVVEDESDEKTNEILHTIEAENHLNVELEKTIEIDTSQNENEDANGKLQSNNLEKMNDSSTALSEKLEDAAVDVIEVNSPDIDVENTETVGKLDEINKENVIIKPVSIEENSMSREIKEQVDSISNKTSPNYNNPNISIGSDGSFRFHLNVSVASTKSEEVQEQIEENEMESEMNNSHNSDDSNKENVESSQKLKIKTVEMGEKETFIGNILDKNESQEIAVETRKEVVARVSNVFKPKMKENSFMEPMEVDEFPSFLNNPQLKTVPDLNESSDDNLSSEKSSPNIINEISKNIINEKIKDLNEVTGDTVETYTINKKLDRQNSVESTEDGSVDDSFKLHLTIGQEKNQTSDKFESTVTEFFEETEDCTNLSEKRKEEQYSDSGSRTVDSIEVSQNSNNTTNKSIEITPGKDLQPTVPELSNIHQTSNDSLTKSDQSSKDTEEELEETSEKNCYDSVQPDDADINSPKQSFKVDEVDESLDISEVKLTLVLEKEISEKEYEGTSSPVISNTKVTSEKTSKQTILTPSEYTQKSDNFEVTKSDVSNTRTCQEIEEHSEELGISNPQTKSNNSKLDEVEQSLVAASGISENSEKVSDDYEFNVPSDEELEIPHEELIGVANAKKKVAIDVVKEKSIPRTSEENTVICKFEDTETTPRIEEFKENEVDVIKNSLERVQQEIIDSATDIAEKHVSSNLTNPFNDGKNSTENYKTSEDNMETTSNRICFVKIDNIDIKQKIYDTVVDKQVEAEKIDHDESVFVDETSSNNKQRAKKKKSKMTKQTLDENLVIEDNKIEFNDESQKIDNIIISGIHVDNKNAKRKKSTRATDLVEDSDRKKEIEKFTSNGEIVNVDNVDTNKKKSIGATALDNKLDDKKEVDKFILSDVANVQADNDENIKKNKSKTADLKNKATDEKEIDAIIPDMEETQSKSEYIKEIKSKKLNINKEVEPFCDVNEILEISSKKSKKTKKNKNAKHNIMCSKIENANLASNEGDNSQDRKLKKNKEKHTNIDSIDAISNKSEKNFQQFKGLDDKTKLKLDEYLSKNLPKMCNEEDLHESSNSEENDSEDINEFICDQAEEGEEDTPSEGSNDIIDDGESINTTESEMVSDEEYDENDSFICNEEAEELLPGEEYDTKEPEKTLKKSRIISLNDIEGDVIKINKKEKLVKKRKMSRIIVISDSSEDENVEDLKNKNKKSIEDFKPATPVEEPKYMEHIISDESTSIISDVDNETEIKSELFENTLNTNKTEKESMQKSRKPKRKSLITVHENISVSEIKDSALCERINLLVDSFCTKIRKGEISMNLSLEYADKDTQETTSENEESDDIFEGEVDPTYECSKKNKNTDTSQRTAKNLSSKKSEKLNRKEKTPVLPTTSEVPKRRPKDSSFDIDKDSEDVIPCKNAKRLSVSADDIKLTKAKKITKKRKLSKSLENIETTDKPEKKMKRKLKRDVSTLNLESNKKVKSPNNEVKRRKLDSSEEELRTKSLNLMNQLITDVRNRAARTIKPSSGRIDLNSSWVTEVVDMKPSTTIVKKEELKSHKWGKIHPKDFRNQMLYDSSRIKRIDTKQLMKRKGVYL